MNLPNKLTISRIIMTFVFMFFLFTNLPFGRLFALVTFAAASITDFLDGYIAKKRGLVSDFGKFMDPIADKILIIGAFLAFVEMQIIPAWMVVIIMFREFIVTGLRFLMLLKGHDVSSARAGKHKTVTQTVTIIFILIYLIARDCVLYYNSWTEKAELISGNVILSLMLITVTLTIVSGLSYMKESRRFFH